MNKGFLMIIEILLLILIIRAQFQPKYPPLKCELLTDAKLNTNLTVKVEHQDEHNAVWIQLAAEFFAFGNIDCSNIFVNGHRPSYSSCQILAGNTCTTDRCMIMLDTSYKTGGWDNIIFTGMNYYPNSSATIPAHTLAHSVYNGADATITCDAITLPTIYEGNITGNNNM